MKLNQLCPLLLSLTLAACASAPAAPPVAPPNAAPTQITSGPPANAVKVETDGGFFYQIPPQTLAEKLKNKDFIFVNTHIPYEGEIEPTDAFIPYDTILQHLDELPADKTAPIYLYCRSGRMSAIAAKELVKAGYTNVWDLAGGWQAWDAAGYEVKVK